LIGELRTALETHMQLEEEVVYPAMKPVTGQEQIEEAQTEHELARSALAEMLNLAPDEPGLASIHRLASGWVIDRVDLWSRGRTGVDCRPGIDSGAR
jgi:hypothetical protein